MGIEHRNGHAAGLSDGPPCWLEVDLDAVAANVRALVDLVGPRTEVCAVVKADAYGLGAVLVARTALESGAGWLAVARVEEGARLRAAGLDVPILLIAGFTRPEAEEIVRCRLTPTVVQAEDALALARAAARAGVRLAVHVKVDTGLTRYGAMPEDLLDLARFVEDLPSLYLEGVYTHFASADEPDCSFTHEQLERFRAALERLGSRGIAPRLIHAANSAGAVTAPTARLGLVRIGIALSGHYASSHVPRVPGLRPAVALRARLLRVYDVPAGASVGYGQTFRTDRPLRLALVPAGYADGVPRAHAGRASVLIRGRRAALVGRVSMDQCVADVTRLPDVAVGDEVTLFGLSAGAEIGLDEYAGWSETIGHEALCRLGARVPRRYHRLGRIWWGTLRDVAVEPRADVAAPSRGWCR